MTKASSQSVERRWGFFVILGLFLGLAVYYNVSTPIYESPDELQHAAFVVWLVDEHALPVLELQEPGPWKQEGTQPPLYYGLAAGLVGRLPHGEADNLATPNPYANIGDPLRPGSKNRVLHDAEGEAWPFQESALFVHGVRLVSTLMAVGTLCAIHRLGRITFPERPGVALAMMGLVAFTPQFLFLSTSINNDNLVILISAWVLVLLADWLRGPRLHHFARNDSLPGWLQLATLGALLGLGVLAKLSGLLLWPLAAGTMAWLAWRAKNWRWLILAGLVVFCIAGLLSGWWFVRNQFLYGELSGTNVHLQVMGGPRRRLPSSPAAILAEFKGFRYSFWALFGWFNILAPDAFYWVLDALALLGVVGFGVFLVRSRAQTPSSTREIIVMLAVWLGLVAMALLRWTVLASASQGRLAYPALPTIAMILVVGWAEFVPRRLRRPVGTIALAIWVVCAALCAALVIRPAYALPERPSSFDELGSDLSKVHVRYGDCCELVGYVPPDQLVHAGDWVPLTLVWRALQPVDEDYGLFVHARTDDGQLVGELNTFHGSGMYPTSQWQVGEIIVDTVYVPISRKAEGPALVRLNIGLYERETQERLPAFGADGTEVEPVFAGEIALAPAEWPEPLSNLPTDTVFGDGIRLAGVVLSQMEVNPGDVVTVTLQWEAIERISGEYTGFVHLVDSRGVDVAQDDHPPLNGRYPTHLWFSGTIVSDPYRLQLPDDLQEGEYELWGGFYDPDSGQRLPAIAHRREGTGNSPLGEQWKDDLVYLGELVVLDE
jgi:4-amino-4-deoxy-L-arabinose transferase-like glycosyltransferase